MKRLVCDLAICIDLGRPPVIDATGVILPRIISIDWLALQWLSKNMALTIVSELHDNRVPYIKSRIEASYVANIEEIDEYDFTIKAFENQVVILNSEGVILCELKHSYGQGLLAEVRSFFDNLINS